ncbi:MAG: hypothetical protein ASARMPREDX12_001327 [Alectoria sarmentosa]|nr:MAG: hypothetical protein ASARMPREDX12_001327 [Alectoria sarmentosa]
MTSMEATEPLLQSFKRPTRPPPRPNYGKIHAKLLPVTAYPLPPLIPHNPLSIFLIAVTYLYRFLAPSSSHPKTLHQAFFSPETRSVHVTDETATRALWESGFFGKGSLSRSEPSWLDREKKRKGLVANETSEEYTAQRRAERKRFKQERARKEREAIEEKLKEERWVHENGHVAEPTARSRYEGLKCGPVDSLAESMESLFDQQPLSPPVPPPIMLSLSDAANDTVSGIEHYIPQSPTEPAASDLLKPTEQDLEAEAAAIKNQEHLQLNPSEAFFLVYALGILQIRALGTSTLLPSQTLFTLFRQYSYFPPCEPPDLQPDDPFLLQYVAYHHFRSLGWVVRPGIKFAVDWLLYLRGPVFSHAEFAIIVLPAYTSPYWRSTEELQKSTKKKESRSWWWLHCVNRVQSQVRKSLAICYVEVPPPMAVPAPAEGKLNVEETDIGQVLKKYKVRELTLKRWTPNRERD